MFKLVILARRRPGMSQPDFMEYYERRHARYGEQVLRGVAARYARRYFHPLSEDAPGPPYDVAIDIWFEDRAAYDAWRAIRAADAALTAEILKDEEALFDRGSMTWLFTEEHVSEL